MLIFSLASLASVVAATAAFETDFPSNPLLLEDFVKTSTFNYHRKNGFIFDTAEGRFHSMSSADIAASADGEVVASARAPPGAGMSRFAFALKPSEDVFIVDTPVFRACVEAVHSVEAEGVLKHEKREQILSSLQAAGLFRFTGSGTKMKKNNPTLINLRRATRN